MEAPETWPNPAKIVNVKQLSHLWRKWQICNTLKDFKGAGEVIMQKPSWVVENNSVLLQT